MLTTLPGVVQFTALVILAEIGDITRFPFARKLAAWAGLTPTVRGSDLTVRHGHISKQGSAWLRWVLNQAAQTAKRSPEFSATYTAIAKRRGKKIATIAISRKLLPAPTTCWPAPRPPHTPTPPARPTPPPRPRRPGRQAPGTLAFAHEPASAALDLLTEQPGPRHMVMAPRQLHWRVRRMGACETTPPATPGDNHATLP